jgi:hypothetical protein
MMCSVHFSHFPLQELTLRINLTGKLILGYHRELYGSTCRTKALWGFKVSAGYFYTLNENRKLVELSKERISSKGKRKTFHY